MTRSMFLAGGIFVPNAHLIWVGLPNFKVHLIDEISVKPMRRMTFELIEEAK